MIKIILIIVSLISIILYTDSCKGTIINIFTVPSLLFLDLPILIIFYIIATFSEKSELERFKSMKKDEEILRKNGIIK